LIIFWVLRFDVDLQKSESIAVCMHCRNFKIRHFVQDTFYQLCFIVLALPDNPSQSQGAHRRC
jgi:hypothetical protein